MHSGRVGASSLAVLGLASALGLVAVGCTKSGSGGGASASSAPGSTAAPSAATTAATGSSATSSTAPDNRVEYIEWRAQDAMAASDISALLGQTLGASAVSSASRAQLRRGFWIAGTPAGGNVLVELDSDSAGVRPLQCYAQVAVSNDLAQEFLALVQTAMATEALTAQTPGLAQPWNIFLHAESPTGGSLDVTVLGDAQANFTLAWKVVGPARPVGQFATPTAFDPSGAPGAVEKIGGTVDFPIDEPTFKFFVNQAYGYNAPQRFNDFVLVPHAWLHLTVTADSTGTIVNVHFDAITTSGARLFVAEAPASTDVGGRFFDETIARMEEMSAQEAAQPGSSKPWGTSFYYRDPAKGVVDVVVNGAKGAAVIAYAVETPVIAVSP